MLNLEEDVISSIAIAASHSRALDKGMTRLRDAVAAKRWDAVEGIRAELLAAVDGYVDHYVAAAKRVDHERELLGGG